MTPATALAPDRLTRPGAWWRAPAVTAGLAALGTAVVVWRDPHVSGSLGACPLLLLTGFVCPACGALRATDDLAHGRVAEAWSHNPLWVALVPVLLVLWARWLVRRRRGQSARPLSSRWAVVALVVLVVFGVLRNLPGLAPVLGP
jgi:hypothetical protein